MKRRDDPDQLLIDWRSPPALQHAAKVTKLKLVSAPPHPALVQVLPWDFSTTFPQPTDEAIDAGVIDESDREPVNLKALHQNYAAQCLATLKALDKVLNARRLGIDPGTGKKPRTRAAHERLRKYLNEEPGRLEHTFRILIETYKNAFGSNAAGAFEKAVRAWHAGIEVRAEKPQRAGPEAATKPRRIRGCLPVPKPLRHAVKTGNFGQDEHGRPIRPSADEIREITETHAKKLIELIGDSMAKEFREGIEKYAQDFGPRPAAQLEAYVRRQVSERGR